MANNPILWFFEFILRWFFLSLSLFSLCMFLFSYFLLAFVFIHCMDFHRLGRNAINNQLHTPSFPLSRAPLFTLNAWKHTVRTYKNGRANLFMRFNSGSLWLFVRPFCFNSMFVSEFRTIINMKFILLKYIKHNKWQLFILLCVAVVCVNLMQNRYLTTCFQLKLNQNILFWIPLLVCLFWNSVPQIIGCNCKQLY